jgi:hypothetical protein
MKVLSLIQLLRMTRTELLTLLTEIAASRADLPDGSPERHHAEANVHKIRWALARGDFSP